MGALLGLLIPALIPVVADGIRGLIGRLTNGAGALPQNVEEATKLMAAEVEKLKALAELDRPTGDISRWVADLRASFRYVAAFLIIFTTIVAVFTPTVSVVYVEVLLQMSGSVFAFLFGDRMYLHLKNGSRKG